MKLVKTKDFMFGKLRCDVYKGKSGEFFMTRQQIGEALEYENPNKQIDRLHQRHKDRLDQFSTTVNLEVVEGKRKVNREMIIYSAKGIYEICRWSHQPKANEFYDNVYEILEGLRIGTIRLQVEKTTQLWQDTRSYAKDIRKRELDVIQQFVDYAIANGSEHATRYYSIFSRLADKTAGISNRDEANIMQLNHLSLVESVIANCINNGITKQAFYKDIYIGCKKQMQMFSGIALKGSDCIDQDSTLDAKEKVIS